MPPLRAYSTDFDDLREKEGFSVRQEVIQKAPERAKKQTPNLTGIPTQMKLDFERRSGLSFDDVRVHYNSDKPRKIGALAYTQIPQVHIGPGQERHLRHELGHVVQQKRGIVRPTAIEHGMAINRDLALEHGADTCILTPTTWSAVQSVVQCSAAPDEVDDEMARALAGQEEEEEDGRLRIPPRPYRRPPITVLPPLPDKIIGELARHHVIPASTLGYIFALVKPGGIAYDKNQFVTHMRAVISRFLLIAGLDKEKVKELHDAHKRLDDLRRGKEIVDRDKFISFIEYCKELFVWDPANWVIGPQNRTSDPKDFFDKEAYEALKQEFIRRKPIQESFDSLYTKLEHLFTFLKSKEFADDEAIKYIRDLFQMQIDTFSTVFPPAKKKIPRQVMQREFECDPILVAVVEAVNKLLDPIKKDLKNTYKIPHITIINEMIRRIVKRTNTAILIRQKEADKFPYTPKAIRAGISSAKYTKFQELLKSDVQEEAQHIISQIEIPYEKQKQTMSALIDAAVEAAVSTAVSTAVFAESKH